MTAQDPQHTSGVANYPPARPRCLCGDPETVHAVRPDDDRGTCSRSGCNCRTYRPKEARDAT